MSFFKYIVCLTGLIFCDGITLFAQSNSSEEYKLSVRTSDAHNVNIEKEGSEYIITTTGPDPYVFLDAEQPVDILKYNMLSFSSFNTSGTLALVLFIGQLDDDHLIEGNLYEIPRTEGWAPVAFDISNIESSAKEPVPWIRIRFGMNAGNKFRISNLCLRKMNDRDRDKFENITRRDQEDQELCNRLESYLNHSFSSSVAKVKVSYPLSSVTVNGRFNGQAGDSIGLAEIPMWEDPTNLKEIGAFIPITQQGSFEHHFARFAEDKHDRLLSGWAVIRKNGRKYELYSAVHYPDDIVPRSNLEKVTTKSIKGIGGCPYDHEDMELLGVGGGNFNILLNEILFPDNAPGRIPYTYCGKIWFVDPNCEAIKTLDLNVREAKKHDWLISAILLLPLDRDFSQGTWTMQAAHPERQASAAFAMPDMLSKDAVEAYAATLTYLCERYSSEETGRIHHWIVHNEIQNGFYWANAGDKRMLSYMNLYQKSLRTVYNIARQFDPNTQVLVSMDHDWNRKSTKRSYRGCDLLNALVRFSHQEGDFQWGIAFHPYPQDINNPRTWEDTEATYRFDTPFITPKNLEVLNAWVEQPNVRYRGKIREIHLTEQGLNSPDYSEKSLRDQAAGMVYTWEKISKLKHIVCYYYHLWADDPGEGGLRLGLRKFRTDSVDPLGKKPIWDVVRAFETPDWQNAREPYKDDLGINNWNDIVYKGKIK